MLYELSCPHCHQAVSADTDFGDRLVKCPHCRGQFRLPPPPAFPAETATPSLPPSTSLPAGSQTDIPRPPPAPTTHRFQFTCPRCESLLEAHSGLCHRPGRCPTCATEFVIPHFDPTTGTVGEVKNVSGTAQLPTPVHAYAASGARAPEILRRETGEQVIRCPRCQHESPIDAERCEDCGLPFTLEGVTYRATTQSNNGYAVASLVLGLVGLPCFVLVVPQILAVSFGLVAMYQTGRDSLRRKGRTMALAGIALGAISLVCTGAAFIARQ